MISFDFGAHLRSDNDVCKTFLDSFRDRRHVFCCKNAVYKHDFTSESIGKTSKLSDFDQFLPCDGVYADRLSPLIIKYKN